MDPSVTRLKGSLMQAKRIGINLGSKLNQAKAAFDFQEQRKIALMNTIKAYTRDVMKNHPGLVLDLTDFDRAIKQLETVKKPISLVDSVPKRRTPISDKPLFSYALTLPKEISAEIKLDLKEVELTFKADCYRSAVILCGRILETSLHRKYYELTGKDILETSPGIGAGKLIAKLKEKNQHFDPGVTEQIHLINQMRISSVHKKQEVFIPTKTQSYAIILFTLDILKKLFK